MRYSIPLHIAIISIGLLLGFFAENVEPNPNIPLEVVLLAFPLAILVAVITLGFFALLTNHPYLGSFFWFIYLSSIFAVSFGVASAIQTFYIGYNDLTPYFIIAGALGYLFGLPIVAKVYKWRHENAF